VLHRSEVVHRDVKIENILIGTTPQGNIHPQYHRLWKLYLHIHSKTQDLSGNKYLQSPGSPPTYPEFNECEPAVLMRPVGGEIARLGDFSGDGGREQGER
jgi:serine/threonine protein kinase